MTLLLEALFSRAASEPDKIVLATDDQVLSRSDLAARIRGTARQLADDGLRTGERIVLAASSSPAFVCGYFAAHLLGAITVPVDPRIPSARLAMIARSASPRLAFLARATEVPGIEIRNIEELGRANDAISGTGVPTGTETDPGAIADILFTSGTTGAPKGVTLSHRAIAAAARSINEFVGNGTDDREVVPLPLSHSFGLGRMRCQILAGGMIALVDGFASTGKIYHALNHWQATGFSFVPAGLAVLFQKSAEKLGELSGQLRWIEIGSASMPLEHKKRLMELLPDTRICMHYGLTEASRSAFNEFHAAARSNRLASIGPPSPGASIRIVDDDFNACDPGVRGRIVVRGDHLMSGYWQDQAATDVAMRDGWLISGDVGTIDADGWLYLEAREKDMINVGGREVSPVEIENILEERDEVAACACIGVPDPQGITGSAVKAFLVAASGIDIPPKPVVLAKHLRGRIEPYKMPIAFEWVDDLPRTPSGKLQRSLLADQT